MVLSRLPRREITGRVSRGNSWQNDDSMNQVRSADLILRRISKPEGSRRDPIISAEGEGITSRIAHVSPSSKVPCARGGRGGVGVRCTLTMEHHDLCGVMMIEGGARLIPELGRRRVYHRDGFPSSIPRRRRRPRFRAAPISARQHLIHTATTLSHPQFYSS